MSLTIDQRIFIVDKHRENLGYRRIQAAFRNEYQQNVSITTIQKWCKRHDETGTVSNKKKQRACAFGTEIHLTFLDNCISTDPDATAQELRDKVHAEFGIDVSKKRINTLRKQLGWTTTTVQYCQMIRAVNKEKRKQWCEEMIAANETFDVCILLHTLISLKNVISFV